MANSEASIDGPEDANPKDEAAETPAESSAAVRTEVPNYVPAQSGGGFVPAGSARAEETLTSGDDEGDEDFDEIEDYDAGAPSGAGLGETLAIVSLVCAVIGIVGSWFGTQFALASQLRTEISNGQAQTAAAQLAPYTKSIHDTALVHGVFALVAVLLAVLAFAWLPPGRSWWARITAQASAVVGLGGLVLAILVMTNVVAHIHV